VPRRTTYAKLAWLQAWHIRDETYGAALAELVNAQFRHPFAEHWGDGTTSSSDGQNFRTGNKAGSTGHINQQRSPGGRSTPISPTSTRRFHQGRERRRARLDLRARRPAVSRSDLRIEALHRHGGFTDHVFALMHLLGFRFAAHS
jgi:TnpA family transposase